MITLKLNMHSKLSIVHCIKAFLCFLFLSKLQAVVLCFRKNIHKRSIETKVSVCKKKVNAQNNLKKYALFLY